jgi:hypothetical protein
MKKSILLLTAIASFGLTSCTKCYTCEAYDTETGEVWDTESLCGEDERDNYESIFNDSSIDSEARCLAD